MVAQEGAAHFFFGPQVKNFVISCWDRFSGRQKNSALLKIPKQVILASVQPTPIFITIMVRNFIMLARWKIYITPESILNGVQYSATQIMYNATSGHAVIDVGP